MRRFTIRDIIHSTRILFITLQTMLEKNWVNVAKLCSLHFANNLISLFYQDIFVTRKRYRITFIDNVIRRSDFQVTKDVELISFPLIKKIYL